MVLVLNVTAVKAKEPTDICPDIDSRTSIQAILTNLLKDAQAKENGGFGFHMWAAVVNRAGQVCAIAHSGENSDSQWPGSRVIAAQKANTANAFSLPSFALSTANLHEATQNGGSLYGLQFSNPVNVAVAYNGSASDYGTAKDAMVGEKIGGVNVFGGGLALYASNGEILGAVGVSGDSSCADHNIAWRLRNAAQLDYVPAGPSPTKNDQIIYTGETGTTGSKGFEHPDCGHTEKLITSSLPTTRKSSAAPAK
ncbi:MAG: heme-binding protein [Methylococcaceae bacterium]|nr:heme-binding protein [Methylococcaceae bacterium]